MAGTLPPIIATLIADTKEFNAKIDGAEKKVKGFAASTDAAGTKFSSFANKASTAIVGAGLVVGVASVKMAADFQSAMTTLVTGAGESEKNIEMVKNGILSMAGVVGQTPKQLAEGMYLIESAGYHGARGLEILKASAEGAAVGNAQMATVANAVTTAMTDYNIPASRANAVTSALIETVASGKTHLEDLASSIGKVMPVASALGINFQTVTGAMATMTNAGLSARFAAQHLQTTLLSLSAPTKASQKALDAVGLSAQQLKNIMSNPKEGLGTALSVIQEAVARRFPAGSVAYVEAMKGIYGSTVAYSTALMLGGSHAKQFADNVDNIGSRLKSNAPAVQGWAKVQKDLSQQLKELNGSGQSMLIGLGSLLLPKLTDIAKFATSVINYFKEHPLAGDILGLAGAGVFAAALALKVKNAMKKVFDASSEIWNGLKSVWGKMTGKGGGNPLTGPVTSVQGGDMISLLGNIDLNTAKMAGGSALGGLTEAGGLATGAEAVAGGITVAGVAIAAGALAIVAATWFGLSKIDSKVVPVGTHGIRNTKTGKVETLGSDFANAARLANQRNSVKVSLK